MYDTKELKDSLNRYLPEDIRIVKVELAKNGFHARKSAKGKNMNITSTAVKSRMYFQKDIVIRQKLDIEAMRECDQISDRTEELYQLYR